MKFRMTLAGFVLASLVGCATMTGAPADPVSQLAVQAVTVTAVDRVVSRDNATPALKAERAAKIVSVANALKALGDDKLSTVPHITAALAPLLDKLNLDPLERVQANLLVQALITVALQRTDTEHAISRVSYVLDQVVAAASAYASS
jgi:hypothetical protein